MYVSYQIAALVSFGDWSKFGYCWC